MCYLSLGHVTLSVYVMIRFGIHIPSSDDKLWIGLSYVKTTLKLKDLKTKNIKIIKNCGSIWVNLQPYEGWLDTQTQD